MSDKSEGISNAAVAVVNRFWLYHTPISVTVRTLLILGALALNPLRSGAAVSEPGNSRRPASEQDLKYWLENMYVHHHYSREEIQSATGLSGAEIKAALDKFQIRRETGRKINPRGPLKVLPYPGGRHPRAGFLEGAVDPQRESKFSVFTPWDPASYLVVDLPEAIWSQLGLIYLAHTHVPTVWTKAQVALQALEWKRIPAGLEIERTLPNGVVFGARVRPETNHLKMELWLKNGSSEALRDLRVQNCVMLKEAPGFASQTNSNKVLRKPYIACRSEDGGKWIITAWHPCDRVWANPPVPCLHSDPKFPDCAPGQTQRLRGWLSFYEGDDLSSELERITQTGWMREPAAGQSPEN